MTWKVHWEDEAKIERRAYMSMPLEDLLACISSGYYGRYYQVWDVVGRRANLGQAGWVLFEVLKRRGDSLHCVPCAEALLKLMDTNRFSPVDLGGTHEEVPENVAELKAMLEAQIGIRP